MKRNVTKIYESFFEPKNTIDWNYYGDNDIEQENPIHSIEKCKNFITKFITLSGKYNANTLFEKITELKDFRAQHIVSTFFLGVYFYNNVPIIRRAIDKKIKKFKNRKIYTSEIEFTYMWFLACLFHDLGYKFEEDSEYESLAHFFQKENLRNLNSPDGVPSFYKKVYEAYFEYRISDMKKNDHGICASFLLFNDLKIIRNEQENSDNKNKKLCWEKSLENVYNFIAWIILAHNIWYTNESATKKAKEYQGVMSDLILRENDKGINYKITLKNHPFLFLFCLVDTIEPIKCVRYTGLLEKIEIEIIGDDKIVFQSNLDCGCQDRFIKQVDGLKDWLIGTDVVDNKVSIVLS